MAQLTEIAAFLAETLESGRIADSALNGIQVRGREGVKRVVTGVSACLELFRAARTEGADLVLVHHGLFWGKLSPVVEGSHKERLKFLLEHDLTLMAFHLPLDRHPELGNNARLLQGLGLRPVAPFGVYHGVTLSQVGELAEPEPLERFLGRVEGLLGAPPMTLPFGPPRVGRVAVCSGAAPELVREAKGAGADLFLTGEATEYVYHYAREEGIHFVAAGHHRTERLGVQAAGDLLAQRFGVEHRFIDIPNPL